MDAIMRRLVAELLGTFALVFVGAGAVVIDASTNGGLGLVGVALAHALVYAVMITATMNISGGYLNPAVTLGIWIARRIDTKTGSLYVGAQLAGAMMAALLVVWLYPAMAGEATSYGTPKISSELTLIQGIAVELILTLFLVSAVFGTALSAEAPRVGGFGIGLVLLFAILACGPLTGAAVNPARAFGPALVSGDFEGHVAYWIGPLLGGIGAGLLWGRVLLPREPAGAAD